MLGFASNAITFKSPTSYKATPSGVDIPTMRTNAPTGGADTNP